MRKLLTLHIVVLLAVTALSCLTALAQDNDKILNRQYADMKRLHFGFSVGVNFQDLNISNNGMISDDGGPMCPAIRQVFA